jgi:hypothetical protein
VRFACTGARPEPFAAGPSLLFDLRIADDSGRRVHSIALRTQFRIEPRQRPYAPEEQARLVDLFGEPARWGETLNPLQLATVAFHVGRVHRARPPRDHGAAHLRPRHRRHEVLPRPRRRRDPAAPAVRGHRLLPGRHRRAGRAGAVERGGPFRLPVATWRAAMDDHYPDSTYIRLSRPRSDALSAYRSKHVITTWDETLERLLKEAP